MNKIKANVKVAYRAVKGFFKDEWTRIKLYFDLRNDYTGMPATVILTLVGVVAMALAYSPAWNK